MDNKQNDKVEDSENTAGKANNVNGTASPSTSSTSVVSKSNAGSSGGNATGIDNFANGSSSLSTTPSSSSSTLIPKGKKWNKKNDSKVEQDKQPFNKNKKDGKQPLNKNKKEEDGKQPWNKNKRLEEGKQSLWQHNDDYVWRHNVGKNKNHDELEYGPPGRKGGQQKPYNNNKVQEWRDHSAGGSGSGPYLDKRSGKNGYHHHQDKGNYAESHRRPPVNGEARQNPGSYAPFISKSIFKPDSTLPIAPTKSSTFMPVCRNTISQTKPKPFTNKDEMLASIRGKFCGLSTTTTTTTKNTKEASAKANDEPLVSSEANIISGSLSPMDSGHIVTTTHLKDVKSVDEKDSVIYKAVLVNELAQTLENLFLAGNESPLVPEEDKGAICQTDAFKDLEDIFGSTFGQNPLPNPTITPVSTKSPSPSTGAQFLAPITSVASPITPVVITTPTTVPTPSPVVTTVPIPSPVVTTVPISSPVVTTVPIPSPAPVVTTVPIPSPAPVVTTVPIPSPVVTTAPIIPSPVVTTALIIPSPVVTTLPSSSSTSPPIVAIVTSTSATTSESGTNLPPRLVTIPATTINPSVITTRANKGESSGISNSRPRITDLIQRHNENKERRKAEAALAPKVEKKPGGKFTKNVTTTSKGLFNRDRVPRRIIEQTQKLPIYSRKNELIKLVRENQVVIVIGDTGCGKSTQIPQYIAEAGLHNKGMIGVTQPRRVAAKSLAIRVAEECGVLLGSTVGYSVRFDKNASEKTVIKYMTNGTLLKECTCADVGLDGYSIIMIDEAHERRIDTDVCLGLLKQACEKRPDLKVIISSTTLEEEKFSQFFNGAPVFKVSGTGYHVEKVYEPRTLYNYMKHAVNTVININRGHPRGKSKGDILVFLPGQEEIDEMWTMLNKEIDRVPGQSLYDDLIIIPCYRAMLLDDQQKIFDETPINCRKVVLATNIAETSITIDGIVYVVDCGFFKQNQYSPESGIYSLVTRRITKFQATQRAGRAGRNSSGVCYRLYEEDFFENKMDETEEPEVTRSSLESMILTIMSLGIADPCDFQFMDRPSDEALVSGTLRLQELSALEYSDDGIKLTDLGRCMVEFPLDPPLAKVVIESKKLGCSSEVLKITALLSFQSIFLRNRRNQTEADLAREKFYHPGGDLLTLLNIHDEWEKNNRSESWCKAHCLNYANLMEAEKIQGQIKKVLNGRGMPNSGEHREMLPAPNPNNLDESIRKAFTAGYFHQLAKKAPTRDTYHVLVNEEDNEHARLHPSCSLREKMPLFVIYQQIMTTKKTYMKEVTVIDPSWIAEYGPQFAEKVAKFLEPM